MSVKSIVKNLFVSGALALSGSVVCSRPVFAFNMFEEDMVKDLHACNFYELWTTKYYKPYTKIVQKKAECNESFHDCIDNIFYPKGETYPDSVNSTSSYDECKAQYSDCSQRYKEDREALDKFVRDFEGFLSISEELANSTRAKNKY